ncbi:MULTISPECIES: alpha/beta fold hydrolase [Streptosporangium]|uniref:Pimeloyl-ACP methyl ester carboxylesterase n=1 Tax=Streptosporangium brasiliense TaxID=47480 RepID=A0ABT9R396_9ACTN|nr:alpha/beta hydrolase [Streptosporangium brasiliense]MDP9863284.1 pimeloyl-ACP methyl ester carboxylesterase [Streptosporangium brasiliense]
MGAIRKLVISDVPVVAEDHGGHGRDVLLLHGGGRTRRDWDVFAELLVDRGFRPVSMDLRGHGESGAAPWSWREVLVDVAAVVEEFGLRRPVIVGHSLGGMVATLWAGEHPECPLAVNLDGHGNPTRPGQFHGLDEVSAARACQEMTSFLGEMGQGLPESFLQIMREIDALDLFAAYRAARCPLLVVSGDAMAFAGVFPEPLVPAWKAYCAWVEHELEAVVRETSSVRAVSLPTGHDPHREDPEGLARLLVGDLARCDGGSWSG